MDKLHIGFMKDLRNWEFHSLYNYIIEVVDTEDLEDDKLKIAFERIKPYKVKFEYAFKPRDKNKYSIANQELIRLRTEYLISLRKRVESFMLSHLPKERDAGNVIQSVLSLFGKKYYVPTIITQNVLVENLLFHINNDENFKKAISTLDLNGLMTEIAKMSEVIMFNFGQCIFTNGERIYKRKDVRKEAYRDLKMMVDTINFLYLFSKDNEEESADLKKLMLRINGLLKYFHTPLKSRIIKNKNRKAVSDAIEDLIRVQKDPQKCLPVGTHDKMKSDTSAPHPTNASTNSSDCNRLNPKSSSPTDSSKRSSTKNVQDAKDPDLSEENDSKKLSAKNRKRNGGGKGFSPYNNS